MHLHIEHKSTVLLYGRSLLKLRLGPLHAYLLNYGIMKIN